MTHLAGHPSLCLTACLPAHLLCLLQLDAVEKHAADAMAAVMSDQERAAVLEKARAAAAQVGGVCGGGGGGRLRDWVGWPGSDPDC